MSDHPEIHLTNQDFYALRRVLARKDIKALEISPGIRLTAALLNSQTGEVREQLVESLFTFPGLAVHIYGFDVNVPPPNPKTDDVFIPLLPHCAQLSDEATRAAESACLWHTEFVNWAKQRSPKEIVHSEMNTSVLLFKFYCEAEL